MADIKIINPISFRNWDDLVLSNKNNTFFLTAAWANVLSETYGYNPLYFTIIDKDELVGLIPLMEIKSMLTGRRGVSLPFTDYCEPITNKITNKINQIDLFDFVLGYGRKLKWKYIEYRGGERLFNDNSHSALYYRHILNLTQSKDRLLSKFRSSTKRNIKKAMREDVQITKSTTLESLMKFYQLHCITRKYHGVPPQPLYFFKCIYKHVIAKKHGIVVLGYFRNNVIAGAVFFHFDNKAIYKYGASDKTYQKLRINNLIMWEAIKWYSERGYDIFCFGRTEPENKGLMQFKNGWGTQLEKLRYYKFNLMLNYFESAEPTTIGFTKTIFKKIPIPLLRGIGSLFYKHVG
jgi:hypothetical protein